MRMLLRMKCANVILVAEIPCEWKFATKFASDCECDGLVHSGAAPFERELDMRHSWQLKSCDSKATQKKGSLVRTRVWCFEPGFGAENESGLCQDYLFLCAVLRDQGRLKKTRAKPKGPRGTKNTTGSKSLPR